MIIRKANTTDIPDILKLHQENLLTRMNENQIKKGFVRISLEAKTLDRIIHLGYAVVCEVEGQIVGYYLLAGEGGDESSDYLKDIIDKHTELRQDDILYGTQACIHRDYRSLGVGKMLFNSIISMIPNNKKYLFGSVTKQNVVGYTYSVNKMGGEVIFEDNTANLTNERERKLG